MSWLDTLFSGYRWYRQWRGAMWYCRYLDFPVCSYIWRQHPIKDQLARGETRIEDYT
jgi:hypothetical protein